MRDDTPQEDERSRKDAPVFGPAEDEASFMLRRAEDERRKIAASSCVVRSVHEDLLEAYEERAAVEDKKAAELADLLSRVDGAVDRPD